MTTTFKLSIPIMAHGKEVSELELKKPSGGTLRRCGFPFKWENSRTGARMQVIDAEAIANYIVELAGVPTSSVDSLAPGDMLALSAAVIDFFGESSPEPSSGGTSS